MLLALPLEQQRFASKRYKRLRLDEQIAVKAHVQRTEAHELNPERQGALRRVELD